MVTLAKVCCQIVAGELSGLSFIESQYVIGCLPTLRCVELVWQHLCQNMKDSQTLYLSMQNHLLVAGRLGSTDWYGQNISYRRQSLPNVDLIESIRFFNLLERQANYRFLCILRLRRDVAGLESLINLPSLVVLSVDDISKPEQLVMSWHRALQVDSKRWQRLKVLNVPQLKSPRLFFDSWQLIPSLLWMGVDLDWDTIQNIPRLNQLVMQAPVLSPMEILYWLRTQENFKLDGSVVVELDVRSNLVIPSLPSYYPLESKFSKLPTIHGYVRKFAIKRTMVEVSEGLGSSRTKRPRHRGIKKGSSLQRFFGWAGR